MSLFRMFRLGLRVAEWATPHVKEMRRVKHLNRTEGQRHLEARNWAEAEKHLTEALSEKHSQKHRAQMLAQLARAQAKQNRLDEAEQTAQAALAEANDPASQWEAVESLAEIQAAQGNSAGAIETLASMEGTEKSRSKPDVQRLATASRQRGTLLLASGRSAEALTVLDQSMKLSEQAWGPEAVETAHALAEIGAAHSQAGNHKDAQSFLGRALKIYRSTSGYGSEEASRGLHNLAMSLEASGDYDAAAGEYERFVTAAERQVGVDGGALASAKIRLAALYVQSGRHAAARELLAPVIGTLERNPNETFRNALEIMAIVEDQSGRPEDAEQWREKVAALSAVPQG